MCITSYLLGLGLPCAVRQSKLHREQPGRVVCGYVVLHVMSAATAAVPARREYTCLQVLRLLAFSSSLFVRTLPTMGSANRVHSETVGVTNRNSDPVEFANSFLGT